MNHQLLELGAITTEPADISVGPRMSVGHILTIDPECHAEVFLEFAFAGALPVKELTAEAARLGSLDDAQQTYAGWDLADDRLVLLRQSPPGPVDAVCASVRAGSGGLLCRAGTSARTPAQHQTPRVDQATTVTCPLSLITLSQVKDIHAYRAPLRCCLHRSSLPRRGPAARARTNPALGTCRLRGKACDDHPTRP